MIFKRVWEHKQHRAVHTNTVVGSWCVEWMRCLRVIWSFSCSNCQNWWSCRPFILFNLLFTFTIHLRHSFLILLSHYPSPLQSASHSRRVAGSFPVSTWPLHSGAGACWGNLRADTSAHPEPRQPGSYGRHQWHWWGWKQNILCWY